MSPETTERKLAAILSADVVGYSRLMAEDDAGTVRTPKAHKDLMCALIGQHAGRVVDAVGDELLADFPSVVDAAACGVAIQKELATRNEDLPETRRMHFRIGINIGDVIVDGDRIYGDGVNIAARVQALAEEGGVTISGTAFDHVEGKLELEFEDLGQHQVKNILKPLRVYRVHTSERHEEAVARTVPGFCGRPAIAVLAFDNLSGDPDQEYFADGIAEDLITRLSRVRLYPVIARNSSFVYKGQAVDVKRVGRELGVGYVVEGSVRRAGDRVRISAQLIDSSSGHHIWAEQYDRDLGDVLALQDEITGAIVRAFNPELYRFNLERVLRRDPQSLDAWECALRGWWHVGRFSAEDNTKARSLFERAIDLDPRLVGAWAGCAHAHYFDVVYQWTDSPSRSIDELLRAAERAVDIDATNPGGQLSLAFAYSLTGRRDEMIAAFELAIELNPSGHHAYTRLGLFLALSGRPEDATAKLRQGMRLNPTDPNLWATLGYMAIAYFAAERYTDAVASAQGAVQRRSDFPIGWGVLATSLAYLDRVDEARAAVEQVLRLQPKFSASTLRVLLSSADPEVAERFVVGFRKAGLEE